MLTVSKTEIAVSVQNELVRFFFRKPQETAKPLKWRIVAYQPPHPHVPASWPYLMFNSET
jgi:hypothetical protein